WFILLCAIPTVQFCIIAFPVYAAYTQANVMFGSQIRYLQFFKYFYQNNVFVIILIIISTLTIVFTLAFPASGAAAVEKELDLLAKSKNTSLKSYNEDL